MGQQMRDIIMAQASEQESKAAEAAAPAPEKAPSATPEASIGDQFSNLMKDPNGFLKALFMQTGDQKFDPAAAYKTSFGPELSFAREAAVAPAATLERLIPGVPKPGPMGRLEQAMKPDVSTPGTKAGAAAGMFEGLAEKGAAKGVAGLAHFLPAATKASKVVKYAKPLAQAATAGALQTGGQGDIAGNAALGGITHGAFRLGGKGLAKMFGSSKLSETDRALAKSFAQQPGETRAAVSKMASAAKSGVKAPMYGAYAPESAQKLTKAAMSKMGGASVRQAAEDRIDSASHEAERFVDGLTKGKDTGVALHEKIETGRKKLAQKMFPAAYKAKVKATPEVAAQLEKDFAPKSIDAAIRAADDPHERAMIPALKEMKAAAQHLHAAQAQEAQFPARAARERAKANLILKSVPAGAYHMISKIQSAALGTDIGVEDRTFATFRDAMQNAAKQDKGMSKAIERFRTASGKMEAVDQGAAWFEGKPSQAGSRDPKLKGATDIERDYKAMSAPEQKLARESWLKQAAQYFSGSSGTTIGDIKAKLQSPHFKAVGETIMGKDQFKDMADFMEAHVTHYEGTERMAKMTEDLKHKGGGWAEALRHVGMSVINPYAHVYHMVKAGTKVAEDTQAPEVVSSKAKRTLQGLMTKGSVADVRKAYSNARQSRALDKATQRKVQVWLDKNAAKIGAAAPKSRPQEQQ